MQIFEGIERVPVGFGPCVVTIGNFDGVHRGHREVLEQVASLARRDGLQSVAMTFDPHPAQVHRPDHAPAAICSLQERLSHIADAGVDATLVIHYTEDFARQSPEQFVQSFLVNLLQMRTIVAGHDIRFGWGNEGNIDTLRALGRSYGFDVVVIHDVGRGDTDSGVSGEPSRWSSSLIRRALRQGDVTTANRMLGRLHRMSGEVVHGDHRGRELGFPTANLSTDSEGLVPADGVYAGWLTVLDSDAIGQDEPARLPVAISVGTNPTFDGSERRVECYVLDRDDLDLYGHHVRVEFVGFVRGQVAFESVTALVEQMHADVTRVRTALAVGNA
ncbi:riboflavin kinase / FMN adenylyltransferase [Micrococcales bacterium KH10]|nr:riboflavin kinase / FMN adenylyltransferase [Micrococcales bacterium KH10]